MKQYKQNQKAYDNYALLMEEKNYELDKIQQKMSDDYPQRERQKQRKQRQMRWKHDLRQNMIDSLQKQVKVYQNKKEQERRINPEDYSFNFMSEVFKNKYPSYNKHQYYEELRQQAEEQRKKRKKQFYMSEQEYKLNKNQLNVIII